MQKIGFFILLFISTQFAYSQKVVVYEALYDTIVEDQELNDNVFEHHKLKPAKFLFEFDRRNALIGGRFIKINGYKIGMEVNERFRFGNGFHQTGPPVKYKQPIILNGETYQRAISYNYTTFFTEYLLIHNFRYIWSVLGETGLGTLRLHYTNQGTKDDFSTNSLRYSSFTIKSSGYVNIMPWLSTGLGVGGTFSKAKFPTENIWVNSPFYSVKVKFMVGRLIKTIFKPEVIRNERKEYWEHKENRQIKRLNKQ